MLTEKIRPLVSLKAAARAGAAGSAPPGRRFTPWKLDGAGSPSRPSTVGATSTRLAGWPVSPRGRTPGRARTSGIRSDDEYIDGEWKK